MDVLTIPDLLRHAAETHRKPDAFLVKRGERWEPVSIDSFVERVRAVAADLSARGVKHGDRVAILSENRIEWAIADQAILSIGAVVVPIYATLPADHVAPMLADSGAVGAFVSSVAQEEKVRTVIRDAPALSWILCFDDGLPAGAASLGGSGGAGPAGGSAARAKEPAASDLATIIYTSGTTGAPKGEIKGLNVWLASSKDKGATWSKPKKVNHNPGTYVLPWATGGAGRRVDEVRIAGDGRPVEPVAEEVGEDESDPDRVGRDPDQHERHGCSV